MEQDINEVIKSFRNLREQGEQMLANGRIVWEDFASAWQDSSLN